MSEIQTRERMPENLMFLWATKIGASFRMRMGRQEAYITALEALKQYPSLKYITVVKYHVGSSPETGKSEAVLSRDHDRKGLSVLLPDLGEHPDINEYLAGIFPNGMFKKPVARKVLSGSDISMMFMRKGN